MRAQSGITGAEKRGPVEFCYGKVAVQELARLEEEVVMKEMLD